jgi:putative ATP-binding cassette transporter
LPSFRASNPQTLTGYTITLLYLISPLQVVMNSMPALARASISLKKVESLGLSLSASAAEISSAPQPRRDGSWERLELVDVTHTYRRENQEEQFVLGPINQTFRPGELVFITGGNGSGKTTLAKLLVGIYPPESGEIRLDGELITDENREFYREHFAVVFSDYFLFDTLLGLDAPQLDESARKLLIQLQLDRKVEIKEGVLSTTALSQGQRKRLALLTAYLEERPIYLFDEWAADQDPFFKDIFYLQLLPELKARGKAVLVISHDDHYYHVADRLIKLDYGKLDAPATPQPSGIKKA